MDEKVNERRGERENKVNDKRDEGLWNRMWDSKRAWWSEKGIEKDNTL